MPISSKTQLATTEANTRYTPSFLEVLGSGMKALVPKTKRSIPFSMLGRNNYGTVGGECGFYDAGFYGGGSPGSTYDYRAAAGELLENSVVAACVDSVGQALADAPPILEKLVGTEWETVTGHPVIDLLNYPNKYHNPFEIWSAVAGAEMTTGEAFWRLEWNANRTQPTEIWYERPDSMRVIGTDEEYIAKYIFRRDDGAQFELDNSDVIHFRYALNPWNARRGTAPIRAGLRQIGGDNSAATFHGALLRNCAVMSLLVSVKDGQNDNTTPDQLDEFTRLLSQKLRGDNAGAIAGVNLPLDVHKMGYSPDEMALDKLIAYYETRICALLRVDPMVVSLGSGTMQKTYANMGEALNDFWERRIMPTKKRHSAVLGAQLLPLFGLDPSVYRISWDYRNVAPLQENEDARHVRYREDYRDKVIDLYDAQLGLGMNPDQSMRGVFYGDKPGGDDLAKSLKVIDRNGMSHDRRGRFDGGGGGGEAIHGAASPNLGNGSGSGAAGERRGQTRDERLAGESAGSQKDPLGNWVLDDGTHGSPVDIGDIRELYEGETFESQHSWVGDEVLPWSDDLEKAKARALLKLVRFAGESSDREAGVAVLMLEAAEYEFVLGNIPTVDGYYRVKIPVPADFIPYIVMHTHPSEETFSDQDWTEFLTRQFCFESHLITGETTYSLYKPPGWKPPALSLEEIQAEVRAASRAATDEVFKNGSGNDMRAISTREIEIIARKYGILYRVGSRNPEAIKGVSFMNDDKTYEERFRGRPGSQTARSVYLLQKAEKAKREATGDPNIRLTPEEVHKITGEVLEQMNREFPVPKAPVLSEEEKAQASAERERGERELERIMPILLQKQAEYKKELEERKKRERQ